MRGLPPILIGIISFNGSSSVNQFEAFPQLSVKGIFQLFFGLLCYLLLYVSCYYLFN